MLTVSKLLEWIEFCGTLFLSIQGASKNTAKYLNVMEKPEYKTDHNSEAKKQDLCNYFQNFKELNM
jgi:hypothetical protein